MRSGCLSLVVSVGVVCAAAVLGALSTALILSFGVSALGQPDGPERIFKVIVAVAAGLAFFLVGRGIWAGPEAAGFFGIRGAGHRRARALGERFVVGRFANRPLQVWGVGPHPAET